MRIARCPRLALVAYVLLASTLLAHAADDRYAYLRLMPLPRAVQFGEGSLSLDAHFRAGFDGQSDERLNHALDRFLVRLDRQCGGIRRMQLAAGAADPLLLTIKVVAPGKQVQGVDEEESYRIQVTASGATIAAPTSLGAMHAMETFLQLVTMEDDACRVPAVTIDDAPRFPWRGFQIDVSRHFDPVASIERTLDGMVIAKLNVFHWHLSDHQGFRAESRKFPRLTGVAFNGEFYTQEQMREVVAYAHDRGIRVVPEFDMPGHTTSWVMAYPEYGDGREIKQLPMTWSKDIAELDPTNEKTYKFIDALIGEMSEIFPDEYFHIGGDEVEGKGWQANPRIVDFMQKKGFKTNDELQAYFNQRLLAILAKHHKKMIGWDEVLNPALPKEVMVQSWRGVKSLSEGAKQGYTGILSAPYYLDAQKTSAEMFLADPIASDTQLTADQQRLIIGGEVCMWAEQLNAETVDSRVWPRTAAIAERFWSPQSDRDVTDMYRRLRLTSLELEDIGLSHVSGPEKLRRNLIGVADPEALDTFASVTEPVSFHERAQGQRTDAYTSLDRLVDAVVADPPARQDIAGEIDAVVHPKTPAERAAAELELRARFMAWQHAAPIVEAWAHRSARLSDLEPRARQLASLAQVGLDALAYFDAQTTAPQDWLVQQNAVLKDAQQPAALVRFVFLQPLAELTQAAASPSAP